VELFTRPGLEYFDKFSVYRAVRILVRTVLYELEDKRDISLDGLCSQLITHKLRCKVRLSHVIRNISFRLEWM